MHRTLYVKSLFLGYYRHLEVVRRQDVAAAEAPQAASVDGAFLKRSAARYQEISEGAQERSSASSSFEFRHHP